MLLIQLLLILFRQGNQLVLLLLLDNKIQLDITQFQCQLHLMLKNLQYSSIQPNKALLVLLNQELHNNNLEGILYISFLPKNFRMFLQHIKLVDLQALFPQYYLLLLNKQILASIYNF